jgi:hypothetical protein
VLHKPPYKFTANLAPGGRLRIGYVSSGTGAGIPKISVEDSDPDFLQDQDPELVTRSD